MVALSMPELAARRQAEAAPWRMGVGLSIGAHLLVGGALMFGFHSTRPPNPASLSQAVAVQIMALPAAPPAPARETPPEPEKPQERIKPQDKLDLPPIPAQPQVKADVTLPPKETAPERKVTPPPTPPPSAQAPPAKAAAAPVQGAPSAGVATAEQNYNAQIVARLEGRKRYPSQARQQRMEDVVYVRIVISRSGKIVSSEIVKSRKFDLLDEAVRDLVRRVDPLPKMPAGLTGETYSVVVPIDFFMQPNR